jgi:hypothetical protein
MKVHYKIRNVGIVIGILIALFCLSVPVSAIMPGWSDPPQPIHTYPNNYWHDHHLTFSEPGKWHVVLTEIPTHIGTKIDHSSVEYINSTGFTKTLDSAEERQDSNYDGYYWTGTRIGQADIASDSKGNLGVIYYKGNLDGSSTTLNYISYTNGIWSDPVSILDYGLDDPHIAFSAPGKWHVVGILYSLKDTGTTIFNLNYINSEGYTKTLISADEAHVGYRLNQADIASDSNGNLGVITSKSSQGDEWGSILYLTRINGIWSNPLPIIDIRASVLSDPHIAFSAPEKWHIVKYDDEGHELNYYNSTGYKGPIFSGLSIQPFAIQPDIASDSSGNLGVIYQKGTELNYVFNNIGPDLWISEVKPVQVVWDADINNDGKIDLVAQKQTAIVANITIDNPSALDQKKEIPVRFIYDGQIKETLSPTVEDITNHGLKNYGLINFTSFPPTIKGDHEVLVIVDPENIIPESNDTNNTHSQKVTVKEVNDLQIVYIPITNPEQSSISQFSPLDMNKYQLTAENSNKFIQATFPLGINNFFPLIKNDARPAHSFDNQNIYSILSSMQSDAKTVKELGVKTKSPYKFNRYVGIVPPDYFSAHKKADGSGVTYQGIDFRGIWSASLATEGQYTTVAHEIGHTFNLHVRLEEYDNPIYKFTSPTGNIARGKAANGFDVTDLYDKGDKGINNQYMWYSESLSNPFNANGLCMMGVSGEGRNTFYWYNNEKPSERLPIWICREDYIDLFKKLRTNPSDPELLYVSGTFSEDGTFSLDSTYWIESGYPDEMESSGDYSIVLSDKDKQIISTTPFPDPYEAIIEPGGIVKLETGVIAFTIPYPREVATVQLTHSGEVISEFNPHEQLLNDSFKAIPDSAFGADSAQRKAEVQIDINEINTLIEQHNILGARNKLEQVKVKLEDWLVDGYQIEDPLQLTKTEVIEVIDNILARLVVITPPNNAPDLQKPNDQTITEGKTISLNLVATDPENNPLTYSFTSPNTLSGASITGNTFTWIPGSGTAGTYSVMFKVTDSGGLSDEETIKISVAIPTNVKIVPKTINLGSKGYFLAFVTLPEAYKGATIDMKTVSCSGAPAVRMMKLKLFPRVVGFVFKTSELKNVQLGNKVTLNVKGELKNIGKTYTFTGADSIKVISKPTWQPDDIKDISKESDDQLFKKYSI